MSESVAPRRLGDFERLAMAIELAAVNAGIFRRQADRGPNTDGLVMLVEELGRYASLLQAGLMPRLTEAQMREAFARMRAREDERSERAARFAQATNQCPDCEFFGGSHDLECPRRA